MSDDAELAAIREKRMQELQGMQVSDPKMQEQVWFSEMRYRRSLPTHNIFFGTFFFSCQGRLAVNFNSTMFQNERIVDLLFLKYWFDELLFVCSELVIGI